MKNLSEKVYQNIDSVVKNLAYHKFQQNFSKFEDDDYIELQSKVYDGIYRKLGETVKTKEIEINGIDLANISNTYSLIVKTLKGEYE